MGRTWTLFVYFRHFLVTMKKYSSMDYKWKKRRWCAWDSNPGWTTAWKAKTNQIH